MSAQRLVVLLNGVRVGVIDRGDEGRLTLRYARSWRDARGATPLSTSMPLQTAVHGHETVEAFLWGLLPDSLSVLERWARRYHVSPRNPFSLLATPIGADCPGAIQLVTPEREDAVTGDYGVIWLSDDEVSARVGELADDTSAWLPADDTGQFSLAGAQAKTTLLYDEASGRWGRPRGQTPTTHIIKPAVTGLRDHDLNEHLCMRAASHLGMAVAATWVQRFGERTALVVRRYDRVRGPDGTWLRVHQEDLCQALAVPPDRKYQHEGGPSPEQVIDLLRARVRPSAAEREDVRRFVDALVLNWLIAGTDAHAKNYALLLSGQTTRLAPLFDIASALPYDLYVPKLKLAMKVGGHYRLGHIGARHWRRFAAAVDVDSDEVVGRALRYAEAVPDAFATARKELQGIGIDSVLPDRLVDLVADRAARCRTALAAPYSATAT